MGFKLKRFFSIRNLRSTIKKGKKKGNDIHEDDSSSTDNESFDVVPYPSALAGSGPYVRKDHDRDGEAAASRLLRSSSAHFSVVTEVDYTSLPPLPHPINSINPSPRGATPSPRLGVQRSGTYTVTVHGRKVHTRTEFPNANPSLYEPMMTLTTASPPPTTNVMRHSSPPNISDERTTRRRSDNFDISENDRNKRNTDLCSYATPYEYDPYARERRETNATIKVGKSNGKTEKETTTTTPLTSTRYFVSSSQRRRTKSSGHVKSMSESDLISITPRVSRLREDPAVATIWDMYDSEGRINSTLFSNSTAPDVAALVELRLEGGSEGRRAVDEDGFEVGRPQTQRTGSTLRELLGGSDDGWGDEDSECEGDISWAERFLREGSKSTESLPTPSSSSDSASCRSGSTPSLGPSPLTPTISDSSYIPSDGGHARDEFDLGLSGSSYSPIHPTISSLEAELGPGTSSSAGSGAGVPVLRTPVARPASGVVFEFLTDKKPRPASCTQELTDTEEAPEEEIPFPNQSPRDHFVRNARSNALMRTTSEPAGFEPSKSMPSLVNSDGKRTVALSDTYANLYAQNPYSHVQSTPPSAYKDTAPSGSKGAAASRTWTPSSRGAGPSAKPEVAAVPASRSVSARRRKKSFAEDGSIMDDRSSSFSRELQRQEKTNWPYNKRRRVRRGRGKENSPTVELAAMTNDQLAQPIVDPDTFPPITPVRHRPVIKTSPQETPSPVSSSELSPMARDLMISVREQRLQAREREFQRRRRSRSRSLKLRARA